MVQLSLQHLSKSFKQTPALSEITLDIRSGEFFSILGPSGCGKTTLLRIIAGFEKPSGGKVVLGGRDVTDVPPQDRHIGMVFQNYALFPHMTVSQNVAFGLETQKVPPEERDTRVRKIVETVHLTDKLHILVPDLSGGEQQRVAVARALVVEPNVLLFDEPLSNLDVALRQEVREELKDLQRATGITTVYVTHDQSEAMSLSDRIAVLRAGRVEQTGTPAEIYENPVNPFVAEFVGGANLVRGWMESGGGCFTIGDLRMPLPTARAGVHSGSVLLALKPEAITLSGVQRSLSATIRFKEYLGYVTHFVVNMSGIDLRVTALSSQFTDQLRVGGAVGVTIDWTRATFFRE